MQGTCVAPPPPVEDWGLSAPPFLWRAPQCVLIADHGIFHVEDGGRLWLDALYLRARRSRQPRLRFLHTYSTAQLYATRMTLQGECI